MTHEIAIVGFGNQAEAWAQNLRDQGWAVRVLLRSNSSRQKRAVSLGFEVADIATNLGTFNLVACLIPDDAMPSFFKDFGHNLRKGQSLIFAHGFAVHFRTVPWPTYCDWILVGPKGIGRAVRSEFLRGAGVPAVLAVENDVTGEAWTRAEDVAEGIGATRAGTYRATFHEEVEADLFSEQALLCGGLPALIGQSYDTLIRRGISPQVAYLECVHELQFIAHLIAERGLTETFRFASPTAQFGGLKGGERVINQETQKELERIFDEIRDGSFSRDLEKESAKGFPFVRESLTRMENTSLEKVGQAVRRKMKPGESK